MTQRLAPRSPYVADDASDVQTAEIFLHHRVLIVPVRRDGGVKV